MPDPRWGPQNRTERDRPFSWWGPVWTPASPLSLASLVKREVIAPGAAALLAALVGSGCSVTVVANRGQSGKTTLLTALLSFVQPHRQRVYLRGHYETFDVLDVAEPDRTALLVNEISPHLPVYLWGAGARRALQAAVDGYQLLATSHATGAMQLIGSLTVPPIGASMRQAAAVQVVALLEPCGNQHRLSNLTGLLPLRNGSRIELLPLLHSSSTEFATTPDVPAVRTFAQCWGWDSASVEADIGRLEPTWTASQRDEGHTGEVSLAPGRSLSLDVPATGV